MKAQTLTIKTPTGTVTAHSTTIPPSPQIVTLVTGSELRRLRSLTVTDESGKFLSKYSKPRTDATLQSYDFAFGRWQADSTATHTAEQVTEILGGVLGNRCVDQLDMEWVKVSDSYGTDYAVRSRTTEVLAFPFSTVLKRIETREPEFMLGVFVTIRHMIQSGDVKARMK